MPFKCVDIKGMSEDLKDPAALERFVTGQLKAGQFMDRPFPQDTIEAARTQNRIQYSGKSHIIVEYEAGTNQKGRLLSVEVNKNGQQFKIAPPFEVTLDGSGPNTQKGVEVPKKLEPTSPSMMERFKLWAKGEKIKTVPSNTSLNDADDDAEEENKHHHTNP